MRRAPATTAFFSVVLLSANVGLAQGKTATQAQRGSAATQTLVDLENKWADALVKADASALDGVLGDGYVSTDPQGHVSNKAQTIGALKSGEHKLTSLKTSDVRVHIYGNAAVVTGIGAQAGTSKGQPLAPRVAFTDTFVQQNGAWRAVATHLSEVR